MDFLLLSLEYMTELAFVIVWAKGFLWDLISSAVINLLEEAVGTSYVFHAEAMVTSYVFLGVCPFYPRIHVYWLKVIYNIPILSLILLVILFIPGIDCECLCLPYLNHLSRTWLITSILFSLCILHFYFKCCSCLTDSLFTFA